MIQNQPILKRLTSQNTEGSAAQNVKKRLLRKAKTMPQQMMDEFLVRQELYERIYKPPSEKPTKLPESKLITVVHQARQRFLEFKYQTQSVVQRRIRQQKVIEIMKKNIFKKVNDPLPIKPEEKDIRNIIMKIILILILVFIFFILY